VELADFVKLADFAELLPNTWNSPNSWKSFELTEKRSCPPANPRLYTECDLYSTEYFHWPAWVSCLAMLSPSSCIPAHQPNIEN